MPSSVERLPLLWYWDDRRQRGGAADMAVDELLLRAGLDRPVLRAYRWSRPAVSIGYAEAARPVRVRFAARPELMLVRRWTGGGVVEHGQDMTYTLVLPRSVPPAWRNSVAVYAMVHQALAQALCLQGIPAHCTGDGKQQTGTLCFAAPVRHDVLVGGRKVAGAGQRRAAEGILHQGSVQGCAVDEQVIAVLAEQCAEVVAAMPAGLEPDDSEVTALTAARYTAPEWTDAR